MSLNGLDDPAVAEAYQSALSEAGGWFLLKYASRDAVEIFKRGTGGLAEARAAVAEYDEQSPLYGFLLYRRRKVIIKYIPEGTSRLLQARVTVHFQSIAEKFSPHDSIFSITSSKDLNDHAVSSACSLHTAAASTCSSSDSTRRAKLDEITEDAEEGPEAPAGDTTSLSDSHSQTHDAAKETTADRPSTPKTGSPSVHTADSIRSPQSHYAPSVASLKNYEHLLYPSDDRRMSSQTVDRPEISELYAYGYVGYKPKVKLGPRPRPSIDSTKRPHTSGNGAATPARAALPPGMRAAQRKPADAASRPKSRETTAIPSIAVPPPTPSAPQTPEITVKTTSPTSVKSLSKPASKKPEITPEKRRLMKALELRKKQMEAAKNKESGAAEDTGETSSNKGKGREAVENVPRDDPEPAESNPDQADEPPGTPSVDPLVDHASEMGDPQYTMTTSSPTSAKLLSDVSTPPSSISGREEDVDMLHSEKGFDLHQVAAEPDRIPAVQVQRESIQSSVTVVPDLDSCRLVVEAAADEGGSVASEEAAVVDRTSKRLSASSKRVSELVSEGSAPSESGAQSKRNSREKRRAPVEPIRIDISGENSDADYLSDDSFMEELQSATVEEAKPISVSKSPVASFFPRQSTIQRSPTGSPKLDRSASIKRTSTLPLPPSPGLLTGDANASWPRRSFSGPLDDSAEKKIAMSKKNVSSGISARIKALAEKSNRESTLSLNPPVITGDPVARRKSTLRTTPPSESTSPKSKHTKRWSRGSVLSFSGPPMEPTVPAVPTVPEPSKPIQSSPAEHPDTVYSVRQDGKRESLSVTAQVAQDPHAEKNDSAVSTDSKSQDFHRGSLLIDPQQSASPADSSSKVDLPTPSPGSSIPPSRDSSGPAHPRSSTESTWRSFGRRLSEAKSPPNSSGGRSMSTSSMGSYDDEGADKEKKKSRTSRLFKRMSSSISLTTRKSMAQVMGSAVKEEEAPPQSSGLASVSEPPPATQVGDLNVQLPDTLLWKRRWVEVDSSGNIVLSLSKANDHPRGIVKRFHLSEFRAPYAPDQDRQEMPYSVVLDFLDGRTLQCACESYGAQMGVLQVLRNAHDAWIGQ